jgi:hypothetical protein
LIAVLHLNVCSVVNLVNFFSIYYFRCSNFIHNTIRVSGSFVCVLTLFTILLLGWVCMGREGFVIYLDQWELNNKLIVHVFLHFKYQGQLTWFYSFSCEARWQFNHLGYELQVYIWQHVIDLLSNFICKSVVTKKYHIIYCKLSMLPVISCIKVWIFFFLLREVRWYNNFLLCFRTKQKKLKPGKFE